MHQSRVGIVQAARKAEGLEAGVAVAGDVAPWVVGDLLHDRASTGVDHLDRTAQLIADDPVGHAALDHQVGHIGPGAVHERLDHVALTVQLGDRVQAIGIQEALHQGAVDRLADAPAEAIILSSGRSYSVIQTI